MLDTNYYVILFHRQKGDLIGTAPIKVPDYIAAIGESQSRVQEAAGAVAFGRTCDSDIGTYEDIEIIFKTGEVPDSVPDAIPD